MVLAGTQVPGPYSTAFHRCTGGRAAGHEPVFIRDATIVGESLTRRPTTPALLLKTSLKIFLE